jgi:SNF2 family DNA or RNA helicase
MDRAHRLGQRRTVSVYRVLTRGTLEERIMGLQRFKLDTAAAVVRPPFRMTSIVLKRSSGSPRLSIRPINGVLKGIL